MNTPCKNIRLKPGYIFTSGIILVLLFPILNIIYHRIINKPDPDLIKDTTLSSNPETPSIQPVDNDMNFYINSSRDHFDQSEFVECVAVSQKGLSLFPDNSSLLINMAVAMIKTGRYFEAHAALQKAVYIDTNSVLAKNNLGWCNSEIDSVRHLIALYTQKNLLNSNCSKDTLTELAGMQYSIGRFEESITVYQKVLLLDSTDASIYNYIGVAYLFLQKIDSAQTYLEKSALSESENELYNTYGFWVKNLLRCDMVFYLSPYK